MAIPLLAFHSPSVPGRGPGGTSHVFFWVRADRQVPTSPPVFTEVDSDLNIGMWYDQSYYDHHLFSTGDERPTYLSEEITCDYNVLDAVGFDGVGNLAQTLPFDEAYLNFDASQKFAVHIAFKADANTDATLFSLHNTGENRDGVSVSLRAGSVIVRITLALDCGDTDNFLPTLFTLPAGLNYADGDVHSISFVYNQDLPSDNLSLTVDGTTVAVSIETHGMFATSQIITLGQYAGDNQFPFEGNLLEVIAQYTGSEDDRAIIYEYFQRKWCAV